MSTFVWQVWQLQRGASIRLIVLSITGGRKPTSGGRTTQTILFRINFDQQSKRARPTGGHNHNHDHDQITKVGFYKIVEFWVLSNIQFSKTESDPLCKDGSVNGRIYERSNFGRCSLLINGSPQWENKC